VNRRPQPTERGATLVEFALVLPLLLTLLLGIVEMGWTFARNVDVGQAAREGVRLAVVNFPQFDIPTGADTTSLLHTAICDEVNLSSVVEVSIQGSGDPGDPVEVTVTAEIDSLTGFLDWVIPDDLEFSATSASRIEQAASWSAISQAC
jgi:Flp pilus assembly protein TadG